VKHREQELLAVAQETRTWRGRCTEDLSVEAEPVLVVDVH